MATEYSGISYFPIQATFFEGNVQELLEAKYGIKGPYLIMQLLCKIYKDGYYLEWGEEQSLIFAHKLGREFGEEEVKDMVGVLLEKGFFDKQSYEKHHILTSESIQRVWIEATTRRKRDLAKLPYLLIEVSMAKEPKKCQQKVGLNVHDVDIFATQTQLNEENADIFRQSKVKQSRELPPSVPPLGNEERKEDDASLPPPPEYALNTNTHNYRGLIESLQHLKVTDIDEIKAIVRLSNYGEKGKPLWKLLAQTNWGKIAMPGKYIIKSLRSSG